MIMYREGQVPSRSYVWGLSFGLHPKFRVGFLVSRWHLAPDAGPLLNDALVAFDTPAFSGRNEHQDSLV